MKARQFIALATVAIAVAGTFATSAMAQAVEQGAQATYKDIEATLGIVPSFMKAFPQAGIPGAWAEFKNLQLSDKTAISPKMKQLIQLSVAAQIPCAYCVYFHTSAAKANGASDDEIKEAVAMAATTRHWSTVLNGMSVDMVSFKREVDTTLRIAAERAAKTK